MSSLGRVRSVSREVKNRYSSFLRKGKLLSPGSIPTGHLVVNLCKKGVQKTKYVHHLVLEAFVGLCPSGCEARHFPDRNPENNAVTNLSWGTKKEQFQDRKTHGTVQYGTKSPNAKLTEKKVLKIRKLYEEGISGAELSRRYCVSEGTIRQVIRRTQWKHV